MKTLSCEDLGTECPFIASGETNEEVIKGMMDHASHAHVDKMKEVEKMPKGEVISMVTAKIKG